MWRRNAEVSGRIPGMAAPIRHQLGITRSAMTCCLMGCHPGAMMPSYHVSGLYSTGCPECISEYENAWRGVVGIEWLPLNQRVQGSSPCAPTIAAGANTTARKSIAARRPRPCSTGRRGWRRRAGGDDDRRQRSGVDASRSPSLHAPSALITADCPPDRPPVGRRSRSPAGTSGSRAPSASRRTPP